MHSRLPSMRPLRRRTLLAGAACGAAVLATGACREEAGEPRRAGADPLEPVLATAVYLVDRHQQAMVAVPGLAARLTPLRDAHRAHQVELAKHLGTVDSGVLPSGAPPTVPDPSGAVATAVAVTPLPSGEAAILADLRTHERVASRQAAAVCLAGPGYRAAVLGSIAAARASHAEALA